MEKSASEYDGERGPAPPITGKQFPSAANRRPAGQSDGSSNLSAIVAADRTFPAPVAELDR